MRGGPRRTAADLEQVVVADAHDLLPAVHDDRALLDDAVRANDDRACDREDGRLWVYDGAGPDGDVALELDVLADDGLGMDRELVAATWRGAVSEQPGVGSVDREEQT
jgi:hypothetical protein